ncbi:MAG: hypothetical protein BGP16_10500 [Sphingobium sp. 66-54]|nr:MAG: hypothetical protein BGP16_10500 [Sphingobium sp. 66-54]
MVGRRKGEKPIKHKPLLWSDDGPIARAIRTGDSWLYAWVAQQCVPMETLSRRSGIAMARLDDLWRGAGATEGELEALAGPFGTDVESLRASIALDRLTGEA